jgi:hypothetical protein
LALSACTWPGSSSVVTAQGLLARAQSIAPHDALFAITLTITSGGAGASPLKETGTGRLTTSPYRQDITLSGSVDGVPVTIEALAAGQLLYTRAPGAPTWQAVPADATSRFLTYGLAAPQLIGREKVVGVATWHVRGVLTPAAPQDIEDLWLRTDNDFPQKVELHATSASSTTVAATLTFTRWNTGVTITVPPAGAITTG